MITKTVVILSPPIWIALFRQDTCEGINLALGGSIMPCAGKVGVTGMTSMAKQDGKMWNVCSAIIYVIYWNNYSSIQFVIL